MSGTYSTHNNNFRSRIIDQRGILLGVILCCALIGFEMFNYSTTEVALRDLLGDLRILGISWATILTIAFCGIDFAGIARLFIPEEEQGKSNDVWYLFGAWLLAATMNAVLTWWGVSLAVVNRSLASAAFINPTTLTQIVPVFVALMIWITRILLIGTFSAAGPRLFSERVLQPISNKIEINQPRPSTNSLPVRQPISANPYGNQNPPRPKAPSSIQHNRPDPEYVPEPGYGSAQAVYESQPRQK